MTERFIRSLLLHTIFFFAGTALVAGQMTMDDCSMHMDDMAMHTEHCAVFALVAYEDVTVQTIASGNWNDPAIWSTAAVPGAGDRVLVDSAHTVTYNQSSEVALFTLRVDGHLEFRTDMHTLLVVNTLVVAPDGYLTIGTAANPVGAAYTATVRFPDQGPIDTAWDPFLFSKGMISHGHLEVHGTPKTAILNLRGNSIAGATNIKTDVLPAGWQPGDIVLVPGVETKFSGSNADNSKYQDELLEISAIIGKTITFTNQADGSNALLYNHKPPGGYNLRSAAGNMTRNVIFETENYTALPHQQRGHVMLMHRPIQQVRYAAFIGLGRSDKGILVDDPVVVDGVLVSGGTNPRGRYALHLHRAGRNDYMGDPVVLEGNVIISTPGWGIVNHSSHADIIDNIVFEYKGSAFVTELGDELGSFVHNLSVKGIGTKDDPYVNLFDRLYAFDLGHEGNGFWLKGDNVELINNIATSCDAAGFNYFSDDDQFTDELRPMVPKAATLQPALAGDQDSIFSVLIPIRRNQGSVAYNVRTGIFFWTHMYNDDNIGDFTRSQFYPNTHNAMSVVSNFKIWNVTQQGISLSYSSQVHLKNGLLLGDPETLFTPEGDSIPYSESAGYGISTNGVTGQVFIEGLDIVGWLYGAPVLRADNVVSGDGKEYDFKTSWISGCTFRDNKYHLYPETGQDALLHPGYDAYPQFAEIRTTNYFQPNALNTPPLALFSHTAVGGTTVLFDAAAAMDGDSYTTNEGNGIAGYYWQFGDGSTGYGQQIRHTYATAGTYNVLLTVMDEQGKTHTDGSAVNVVALPLQNAVKDPHFDADTLGGAFLLTGQHFFFDAEWLQESNWVLEGGKAMMYNSSTYERPLTQVIRNYRSHQGLVPFSLQSINSGGNALSNDLFVEVLGINGEFMDPEITTRANISPINNADATYTRQVLLSANYGQNLYNWQTFYDTLDLGAGYDYLVLKIYSQGVRPSKNDVQGVDNICFPCDCDVPVALAADAITGEAAYLYWDNNGSQSFEVRLRAVGGTWNTIAVNNTFLQATALLPLTNYEFQVRTWCAGAWTAWSELAFFATATPSASCTTPDELTQGAITATGATLAWNAVPEAIQYRVSFQVVGTSGWSAFYTSDTSFTLIGLVPGTLYTWRVIAECPYGWTEHLYTSNFSTDALRMAADSLSEIAVYPNPADDIVYVAWNSSRGPGRISITDLGGRMVGERQLQETTPSGIATIPVEELAPGVYFLSVEGAEYYTERLIIE